MSTSRFVVDRYVVDTLMRDLVGHDKSASAFLVYLYLTSAARLVRDGTARVSHQRISNDIGLSKSAVQRAIRLLVRRGLIRASRASQTAIPAYVVLTPWRR